MLHYEISRKQEKTLYSYELSITVPIINYKQPLVRISHDIKLFPAILTNGENGKEYTANKQDGFEDDLGAILSSEEARTIIGGLLAQAKLESELHA